MSALGAIRRAAGVLVGCALLSGAAGAAHLVHGAALGHPAFVSGWALVAAMLLLTAYNLRKKLDFLPALLASRHWLWGHLVIGYASVALFVLHVGARLPEGPLESLLWAQFVGVCGSGVLGHYISRRFPALLADRGQEALFERIPALIAQERARVEALVLRVARENDASDLPELYRAHLAPFFAGPCHAAHHLLESRRPLEELLRRVDGLERLSGHAEREALVELRASLEAKSDLDYHHAHQALLKGWLLVHVPLAYSLLVVATLHVVLAYAFGGIR